MLFMTDQDMEVSEAGSVYSGEGRVWDADVRSEQEQVQLELLASMQRDSPRARGIAGGRICIESHMHLFFCS